VIDSHLTNLSLWVAAVQNQSAHLGALLEVLLLEISEDSKEQHL
jgi:hypothetical protein